MPNERWRPGDLSWAKKSTNLGKSVILTPPPGGISDLVVSDLIGYETRLKKEADLVRDDDDTLGSTVLVLQSDMVEAESGGNILPIVANVEMGAGGARNKFQIDAWRAVVPLPVSDVRVSVGWDHLLANSFNNQVLPKKVRVTATLHRTWASPALMTRTRRGTFDSSIQFRVSPFARSWRVFSDFPEQVASTSDWVVGEGLGVGSVQNIDAAYDGADFVDMIRFACERRYPANADYQQLTVNSLTGAWAGLFTVVQELGF